LESRWTSSQAIPNTPATRLKRPTGTLTAVIRVEHHPLGPRLHVLGRRLHECHVGLAVAVVVVALAHAGALLPAAALGVVASWLVAKDWRDLHPATRDTAAWSLGLHRRPDAPPAAPARDRVPALAALATAAVGAINVASAMTPELPARVQHLLAYAPAAELRLAHALALPAGLALVAVAWPLARRRRGALQLAAVLLTALGALDLLKGLDVEEALLSWALAFALWRSRAAFWVMHERAAVGRALRRSAALLGGAVVAGMALVAIGAPHAAAPLRASGVPEAALGLLSMTGGGSFTGSFAWLPTALGILGAGSVAAAGAMLLAPLRPRNVAARLERHRAAALVRRHGSDSLSAFKLRADLSRRYSADGRAVVAYRIEAGAMLLAGDPVGPDASLPAFVGELRAFARRHGLALGAVGASERFAATARTHGLRRLYLGDEALLAGGPLDLSGRPNKNLRNAVRRVERAGYTASAVTAGSLDATTLAELHAVSARWRDGAPERGFSMAHDALVDELLPEAVVVLARDGAGAVRAFLEFVPVYGRPAMSLAFMRRDRDTPNGLSEYLVLEAARLLGERGVEELSLNFATCGRWLRAPANVLERAVASGLRIADRWFQIERLLRFNAKFAPRWQPRYLLFDGAASLPRVALAAMWAEGQLPRPALARRAPVAG
jgi:lysyl-tRNA synthetase class 2